MAEFLAAGEEASRAIFGPIRATQGHSSDGLLIYASAVSRSRRKKFSNGCIRTQNKFL